MRRVFRYGAVILVVVLVVGLFVGALGLTVMVRRPFPKTAGTVDVAGLQGEVNVYRDEYGVPHIYAENEHDLFFAQGYVHAQDRFWQMEFWRHVGQGRLAEMLGPDLVETDKFIRTMGWNRMAANTLAYYEEEQPEYIEILNAYSDGVNAYIEENREALSLNRTILTMVNDPWEIEPWTPINTISWGVVMADDLSGNWSEELDRAELIQQLGEGTVQNLLPFYDEENRPVIAPTDALSSELPEAHLPGGTAAVDWSRVNTDMIGEVPPAAFTLGEGPWLGSNNWVISGEHTDTGLPLLANDPHLGIQLPSIWYEVGLNAPGWQVTGFSFAGVPGVIIGHNDRIAWGVTNVGPDVQDLYIEKINPSNPLQYEFMGEWQDMEVIEEVIQVNGGEAVTLEVKLTQHGPIINEIVDGQSDVLAFKWTAAEPSRVLQAVFLLNQAENYDDFREALRFFDVPSQNVIYADVEGNIAYQMPGYIPIRQNGDGLRPVPGWTGEYEWEGWVPYEELPALYNPEWGYIVTANHAVVDEDYPYLITHYWDSGDRGQRIVEMIEETLEENGELTADDMARIQFDSKLLLGQSYVPLFADLSSNDSQVQAAIERLRGWDLQMQRDSVPAALFAIFYREMAHATLDDEIGEEAVTTVANPTFFHTLAEQPDAAWWDNTETDAEESQEDIMLEALERTVAWFEENQGGDMNEWTWGSLHTATFVSNPLGQSGIGALERIVNRGPFPADGSNTTVNANGWSWTNPAEIRGHPSMRMILDLSDFDASRGVHPTGQSGHPFHPHYDDMIPLWLDGQYHPMLFSQAAVEEAAVSHLVLQPAEED
jgi:penicillin amidase